MRPLPLCKIRPHSPASDDRSHYAPAPCVHSEDHTHPPEHSESAPPKDGKANHCRQEQRGDDKSQDADHGSKVLGDVEPVDVAPHHKEHSAQEARKPTPSE